MSEPQRNAALRPELTTRPALGMRSLITNGEFSKISPSAACERAPLISFCRRRRRRIPEQLAMFTAPRTTMLIPYTVINIKSSSDLTAYARGGRAIEGNVTSRGYIVYPRRLTVFASTVIHRTLSWTPLVALLRPCLSTRAFHLNNPSPTSSRPRIQSNLPSRTYS